jgi:hypothetical protein
MHLDHVHHDVNVLAGSPFLTRPPKRLEAPACRPGCSLLNEATRSPFMTRPPKRLEAPACRPGCSLLNEATRSLLTRRAA